MCSSRRLQKGMTLGGPSQSAWLLNGRRWSWNHFRKLSLTNLKIFQKIIFDKFVIMYKNYVIWILNNLKNSVWQIGKYCRKLCWMNFKWFQKILFAKYIFSSSENGVWHLWPDDFCLPTGLRPLHSARSNCLWLHFVFCGLSTFQYLYQPKY